MNGSEKMNVHEQSVIVIQRAWRSRKNLMSTCFHCNTHTRSGWKKEELSKHLTNYIDVCIECGNILGFLCYCCDGWTYPGEHNCL